MAIGGCDQSPNEAKTSEREERREYIQFLENALEPGFTGKIVSSKINSKADLRRELRNARRVYRGKHALYEKKGPRPKSGSGYLTEQADASFLVTAPPPDERVVSFKSTMDFWGDVTVNSADHTHDSKAGPHSGSEKKPTDDTPKPRSTRTTGGHPISGREKQCSITATMRADGFASRQEKRIKKEVGTC